MSHATTILVVCAWCSKPVGSKPGHGVSGVSHTICPDCLPSVSQALRGLEEGPNGASEELSTWLPKSLS